MTPPKKPTRICKIVCAPFGVAAMYAVTCFGGNRDNATTIAKKIPTNFAYTLTTPVFVDNINTAKKQPAVHECPLGIPLRLSSCDGLSHIPQCIAFLGLPHKPGPNTVIAKYLHKYNEGEALKIIKSGITLLPVLDENFKLERVVTFKDLLVP